MLDGRPTEPAVRGGSRGWLGAVAGGLLLWAAVRAVVAVVSVLASTISDGPTDSEGRPPGVGFFGLLHHWDSGYFLAIAGGGYLPTDPAPPLVAFFPGYPFTARGLAQLISLGAPTSAVLVAALCVVSAVASLVAAVVLWRLTDVMAPGTAPLATVMFLAGPYAVFLYANYSESLFVVFAAAAWYCGLRDRWWLVGGWSALATATRINGCFLVAALVVMYVGHRRRNHQPRGRRRRRGCCSR